LNRVGANAEDDGVEESGDIGAGAEQRPLSVSRELREERGEGTGGDDCGGAGWPLTQDE